jgi:methylmalonyl-CoA mutase N-terminal domain/subunit
VPPFKIDDSIGSVQSEKLKLLKAKRDNAKVTGCLQQINNAALSNKNLMPFVLEAVENYCTLGEISDELRKVFGEFK